MSLLASPGLVIELCAWRVFTDISCHLKSIQADGGKEKKNMKDPTASVFVVAAKKQVNEYFQVLLSVSGHLTSVHIVVLAISALPSGFKEQKKTLFFSGCVIPVAHFNN